MGRAKRYFPDDSRSTHCATLFSKVTQNSGAAGGWKLVIYKPWRSAIYTKVATVSLRLILLHDLPSLSSRLFCKKLHGEFFGFMLSERLSQTIADVPEIQLAYLFGSGAHDRLEPESDIDVAVAAREPLKMDLKIELIEKLALETNRPIDLIDLHTAPPTLLATVLDEGRRIANKDPELTALFTRRLMGWNADMAQNHEMMMHRRRNKAFSP